MYRAEKVLLRKPTFGSQLMPVYLFKIYSVNFLYCVFKIVTNCEVNRPQLIIMITKGYKPFYLWVLVSPALPFLTSFFSTLLTAYALTLTMCVLSTVNKCCTFCGSSVLHNALTYQNAL